VTTTTATTTRPATRAETLARRHSKPLEKTGWEVEITVSHQNPEYYQDGSVMLDGRTFIWVYARRKWHDGTVHFGWVSRDGAGDFKATTRYLKGTHFQASGNHIPLTTYTVLRTWVGVLARKAEAKSS
jgi:hypothetical protein